LSVSPPAMIGSVFALVLALSVTLFSFSLSLSVSPCPKVVYYIGR
jgi:hypothetical protein